MPKNLPESDTQPRPQESVEERRNFLKWFSSFAMFGGLVAAYGTLGAFLGRFLYPARPAPLGWLFVSDLAGMEPGSSLTYRLPSGSPVSITRRGHQGAADDFIALSSTCPHLGCQVHWEAQNKRFFCPCHNGVFNPEGKAISGPPADAGQSLPQYSLKVERGLLFIEVPLDQAAAGPGTLEKPSAPSGLRQVPCRPDEGSRSRRA